MSCADAWPCSACFRVPADGLLFVFFHSQAVDVAEPQVELGCGVALPGRLLIPVECLVVILRDADAIGIGPSQVELGGNVAQFRRLMVAVKGFLLVFRYASPLFIIDSQLEQCLGISRQAACWRVSISTE